MATTVSRRREHRDRRKDTPARRTAQRARNRRTLPVDKARSAHPLDRLLLEGRQVEMVIGDRLTAAGLERTIEGPNTLTLDLFDADRAVLKSGAIGAKAMASDLRTELDGLGFMATGVSKQGDTTSVTFEDEVVTFLKRHGKHHPLRFPRSKWTRAEAAASMIRAAGVPVIVLDELVVQPVAGQAQLDKQIRDAKQTHAGAKGKGRASAKGIAGDIQVKGRRANSEQRRNIAAVLASAAKYGATGKALQAVVVTPIPENNYINNHSGAGREGYGLYQVTIGGGISAREALDIDWCVHRFLKGPAFTGGAGAIELARKHPNMAAWEIAATIEGPAAQYRHRYADYMPEANKIIAAAQGLTFTATETTIKVKEYAFERKRGESTWAAAWRLLVDEVKWRLFVREGVVIIASDIALARSAPKILFTEHSDAVEDLDFDLHRAARANEMTAQAYVRRWQADPGDMTVADDLPEIAKRWLLASTSQSLLDDRALADIKLIQPQRPAKEPAPDVSKSTRTTSGGFDSPGGSGKGYVFPLRAFGSIGRLDRGVDMESAHSHGHYVAIGNARIKEVNPKAAWRGVVYELLDGDYKGWVVFNGHGDAVMPGIHVGDKVPAGTALGTVGSGVAGGGSTHIETGFMRGPHGANVGYGAMSGSWKGVGSVGAHEMYKLLKRVWPGLPKPNGGYGPPGRR